MDPMLLVFLVIAWVVVGFVTNKIPFGVVAVTGVIALEIGGVLTWQQAWAGFSDRSVVLVLSMFVIGGGLARTSLITRMKRMLLNYNGKDTYILWAIMGSGALLSIFTASSVAMATLVPIIVSISEGNPTLSRTRAIKSAADMSMVWSNTFPIGMAAATFMLFNSIVNNMGGEGNFQVLTLMQATIIPAAVVTIWHFAVGYRLTPKEAQRPFKEIGNKIPELPDGKLTIVDWQNKHEEQR